MPYADPTRSAYCAARHLLRRLADAPALRRNPLVAQRAAGLPCDDGLLRDVRAVVDRAFAAMDAAPASTALRGRRHAAILLRCDVLREPREAVARDMGISLPHFERERRRAMARFVRVFTAAVAHRSTGAQVRGELGGMVRRRAMRLADSGDRRSALVLLDDVVRTASRAEKIRALVGTAEIETNEFAISPSRTALAAARHLLSRLDAFDGDRVELSSACEAAALRLRTVECGPDRNAVEPGERFERRSETAALLIARAEVADASGTIAACRPLVARASELLRRDHDADAALRVDLAFLQAQVEFWSDPSIAGRAGLERAVGVAREAGYAGRAAFGELSNAGGRWARSGDPHARRAYRRLLANIARATDLPKQTRFFAFWDAADIECGIGDPWRAADAARRALALAPNAQRALVIEGLLARAFARGGRCDVAERTAMRILEHPAKAQAGVAQLLAKRTLADVASLDGRSKQSWESLRDAAELARRYGTARLAASLAERLAHFKGHRGTPFPSFS